MHYIYSTPNFELIQDVECKKYTIDGHKTCSMINTETKDYNSETKFAMLTVNSLVNGTSYMFLYGANPDNFDTYSHIKHDAFVLMLPGS